MGFHSVDFLQEQILLQSNDSPFNTLAKVKNEYNKKMGFHKLTAITSCKIYSDLSKAVPKIYNTDQGSQDLVIHGITILATTTMPHEPTESGYYPYYMVLDEESGSLPRLSFMVYGNYGNTEKQD